MTRYAHHGPDEYVDAVETLYAQDETDAMNGGVPPVAVARRLGVSKSAADTALRALVDEGRLERCHGMVPGSLQQRISYAPADDDEVSRPGARSR